MTSKMQQSRLYEEISATVTWLQDITSSWTGKIMIKPFLMIYVWFLLTPLYLFYRNSPWWTAGFEGRESSDICHQLTGYHGTTEFWRKEENIPMCEEMIFRQFMTFIAPIHFLLYLVILAFVLKWAISTLKQTTLLAYEETHKRLMRNTRLHIKRLWKECTPPRSSPLMYSTPRKSPNKRII